MKLSVVTSMYCSEPYLEEFYRRVSEAARACSGDDYEITFVNDGSPDASLQTAVRFHEEDPHVKVIDLSRNFGHHKAMMTGLMHARGARVLLIDCDLEEAPELLERFVETMDRSGADVVFGVQENRGGSLLDRFSAWLFYTLFNLFSVNKLPRNLVTMRLMTARYVRALVAHQEREVLIAGLWVLTGFHQQALKMEKPRKRGTTYTVSRKVATLVNAVTSFSNRPLVFILYLGASITILAALVAGYLIVRQLVYGDMRSGWPSVMVSIWFLGGLMIFCIGVIGIYLSRVFTEVKQRPYTIVRAVYDRSSSEGS